MLRFRLMVERGPCEQPQASEGEALKQTSVCIVDDTGRIVREVQVASEPEALLQELNSRGCHFKRIGLEAGPLSQWLFSALAEASPRKRTFWNDRAYHASLRAGESLQHLGGHGNHVGVSPGGRDPDLT